MEMSVMRVLLKQKENTIRYDTIRYERGVGWRVNA